MATYKDLFFKAIDQLVETVKTKEEEIAVKNKIKVEIQNEELRVRYSNIKNRKSIKEKFRNFYKKFDTSSLSEIVDMAKDIIDIITTNE